jgi:hypothetical protein
MNMESTNASHRGKANASTIGKTQAWAKNLSESHRVLEPWKTSIQMSPHAMPAYKIAVSRLGRPILLRRAVVSRIVC